MRAWVRQLELRLEDLFLVRENEAIMNRNQIQEGISESRRGDEWVTVRKGKKKRSNVPKATPGVVSQDSRGKAPTEVERAQEENASEGRKGAGCEIVVEDGRVKGIDRWFCGQK